MATVSAARASSKFPVFAGNRGVVGVAHGTYEHLTNLSGTTVIEYCRIPGGSTVFGGWWGGDDLDTGTEALDIDIGWAANGVETADPDGFGNMGVLTGDVSVHLGAVGIWMPLQGLLVADGPKFFTNETILQGVVNVTANAGGTGTSNLIVYYYNL